MALRRNNTNVSVFCEYRRYVIYKAILFSIIFGCPRVKFNSSFICNHKFKV